VADDFAQHYHEEMAEFENMSDAIRDIDYYKAETEAARNGHTAAMDFAMAKSAEAAAARTELNMYKEQLRERVEKFMPLVVLGLMLLLILAFTLGRLVG